MIVTDRYENHTEEWRDEENRRRLGIPEEDNRFGLEEQEEEE